MAPISYILAGVLAHLCCSTSVITANVPSGEDEFIVIKNNDNYSYEGRRNDENNIQLTEYVYKSINQMLYELKEDLNEKDNHLKIKLNMLEHNIEFAIENKLTKMERHFMDNLADYFDEKLNTMTFKSKTQNQNMNCDLQEVIDKQDHLDKNIKEIQVGMGNMEDKSNEQAQKLHGKLQNMSISFEQKLDSVKNMTIMSSHTINETLTNVFKQQSSAVYSIIPRLDQISNSTINCCNKYQNKINLNTGLLSELQKTVTKISSANEKIMDTTTKSRYDTNADSSSTGFMDLAKNSTHDLQTRWTKCNQEIVQDTEYRYGKPLKPLDSEEFRHVSLRTVSGRAEFLHMRFGLQADNSPRIILSPESDQANADFYFYIAFWRVRVHLWLFNAGRVLARAEYILNLSDSEPVAVNLTISNDTLYLQDERSAKPFLEHHDVRFGDIKYFGFDAYENSAHHAIFYYDC